MSSDNRLDIEIGALLIAATIVYEARIRTGSLTLSRDDAIAEAQQTRKAIIRKRIRDDPTKG